MNNKIKLTVFFLMILSQTIFAFEISKSVETNDGFIPYSRYLEKLDKENLCVTKEMSDEEKAEAEKLIDENLEIAKGDFVANFERDGNYRIDLFEGFTPVKIYLHQVYKKDIRFKDNNLDIAWLDEKLTKLGASRYRTSETKYVYYLKTSADRQCFIIVENEYTKRLYFVCSYLADNNSTITITKDDFTKFNGKVSFFVNSLPDRSLIAKVTVNGNKSDKDARLEFNYRNEMEYEKHEERYNKRIELEPKRNNEFILDGLPNVDGQLCFVLEKRGEIDSVSIKFETGEKIPTIKYGAELGMVILKGIDPGLSAELEPYYEKNGSHDILHSPILDDTGSFVFSAPAGHYKLLFGKNPYVDFSGRYYSHNIPVNAGEATEITIPSENANAINELRKAYISTKNKNTGSIQLNNLSVKDSVGTLEMVINDPLERDVFPEKEEIKIQENGVEGKVTKIEREPQPVDVVLVLDSSGSMGQNMKPAVEAAKDFVKSLPDNTGIRFIQFAQKITIHKGEKKADVIKALDTVKSVGATAMYDALEKALKLLEKKKKPYIVLFSDGADSREPGVDGKGSNLTKQQIIDKLKKSKATLLTIGFGSGHDPKTLKAMSEVTPNGMYVAAADKEALPSAFAAVSSKFGNQFKITYERPYTCIDTKSDVPIVAIMLDCSGSMDKDPKDYPDDDVDFRMDKVKIVFHDFINNLSSNTLISLMTFTSGRIDCKQILTDKKADILKALSECKADGGTPINDALTFSLENLKSLNSSKKLLIFFTDAALDLESKESESLRVRYETLLKELKKSNIRVLFAGLGGDDYIGKYKAPFEEAAKIAGGDYIITSKTKDIADKLNELLKKVDEPVSTEKKLNLSVALDSKTEDGSRMNYSSVKMFEDLHPLEKEGEVVKPGLIQVKTGQTYAIKPKEKVTSLAGTSKSADTTEVFSSVKYQNKPTAKNKFASVEAQELYLLKKFKDFSPKKDVLVALKVKISFQKANSEDKETAYIIPSIFNHFYLSLNNSNLVAPSKLTWLADMPLTKAPEKVQIYVDDKNSSEGFLIFDMPYRFADHEESGVYQLSLHIFDEANGHIELPIVGKISEKLERIKSLPNKEPQKISDAFSLKIKGYEDRQKIGQEGFYDNDTSSFRIIETDFISNVSALLDINPMERFYYAVETDNGPLMNRMNNMVYSMPLGFISKMMFSPGYSSSVRMPFVIGKELASAPSYIWGDVAKGEVKCSVTDGKPWSGKKLDQKFSHEYFDLIINDMGRIDDNRYAIVDFTIVDKPDSDGLGTGGVTTLMVLDCKAEPPDDIVKSGNGGTIIKAVTRRGLGNFGSVSYKMPGRIELDKDKTKYYAYGIDDKWGVFDGMSRRGIAVFNLDRYKDSDEIEIISDFIPSLKLKLPKAEFTNKALLCRNFRIDNIDFSYDKRIDEAVREARLQYEATHKELDKTPNIGLNADDKPFTTVAVPSLTFYGSQFLNSINKEEDIVELLQKLKIDFDSNEQVYYSPEAVLTQGWGRECDLAYLTEYLLTKLGYAPLRRTAGITKEGAEWLKKRCQSNYFCDEYKELYAFEYKKDGKTLLFVPAFGKYLSDLKGLCYYKKPDKRTMSLTDKNLKVSVYGKLIGNAGVAAQQAIASNLFSALGGREDSKTDEGIKEHTILFERRINVSDFTKDLFDISFQTVGKSSDGKGDIICAVVDGPNGVLFDKRLWIDTSCYEIESVTVELDGRYKTTRYLKNGKKLSDLNFTIGYFLPELSDEAVKAYEDAVKVRAEGIEDASNYAKLKWNGHASIARFVRAFGKASKKVAEKLDATVCRVRDEDMLALAAISESDGKDATIGIDLINIGYYSRNKREVMKSFNSIMGLMASQLEASVLPGGKGESYANVWATLPVDAGIFVIDNKIRKKAVDFLKEKAFPKLLVDRVKGDNHGLEFIVPTAPGLRNGEECWAWLEINYDNGVITSWFDNGERSGMAGYVIGLTPYNECNFAAGAVIGQSCANFAIAAYTLETEDEEAVWKSAKELCQKISEALGTAEGLMSAKDVQSALTGFAGSQAGGFTKQHLAVDYNEVYKHLKIIRGDEAYNPTFAEGFKMAIDLYFGD